MADTNEYVPLDLGDLCNARAVSIAAETAPLGAPTAEMVAASVGAQTFRGLPFRIGREGAVGDAPDVILMGADNRIELSVPVRTTARWLIFAHRLLDTGVYEGGHVGGIVGTYAVEYADGEQQLIPIRERFEIAFPDERLTQTPFLGWWDLEYTLPPRLTGAGTTQAPDRPNPPSLARTRGPCFRGATRGPTSRSRRSRSSPSGQGLRSAASRSACSMSTRSAPTAPATSSSVWTTRPTWGRCSAPAGASSPRRRLWPDWRSTWTAGWRAIPSHCPHRTPRRSWPTRFAASVSLQTPARARPWRACRPCRRRRCVSGSAAAKSLRFAGATSCGRVGPRPCRACESRS